MKRLTEQEIEQGKSEKGGFTREQLTKWGVPWPPPKGWKKKLLGVERQPDGFSDGFQLRMTLDDERARKLKGAAERSAIETHQYALMMLGKMIDRGEFLAAEDWWRGTPDGLEKFKREFES